MTTYSLLPVEKVHCHWCNELNIVSLRVVNDAQCGKCGRYLFDRSARVQKLAPPGSSQKYTYESIHQNLDALHTPRKPTKGK